MGLRNKVSGMGYVILQCMRALNIIALLAVIAASVVMLIKTFIVNGFFFFDTIGHVITALLAGKYSSYCTPFLNCKLTGILVFLILSEIPFISALNAYFIKNWPLLSFQHGFATLGLLMMIDGISVLGNLNSDNAGSDKLGASFYQIIIAGGILCFVVGVLNVIASYIFRNRKAGVSARMVRAYGAQAANMAADVGMKRSLHSTPSVRTVVSERPQSLYEEPSLPSYHPRRTNTTSSRYSQSTSGGLNISRPMAFSKGGNQIEEPEEAAHPAFQREHNFV